MSHHPERTARNVRPVNQPPSKVYINMKMAMLDLKRLVLGLVLCGLAAFAPGGSVADGGSPRDGRRLLRSVCLPAQGLEADLSRRHDGRRTSFASRRSPTRWSRCSRAPCPPASTEIRSPRERSSVPAQVAEAVPIATDKRAGSFSASTPTATSTGCGSWTAARAVAS